MVQPNAAAAAFTYWMLNISEQKLSGPQRILTEAIYTAAINNTPVSNQDWYNFNLFSAWRNQFYIVYRDYAQFTAPDLLNNLIASFNLDGNFNPDFGPSTGTDTNVLYNAAYGKIGQGARYGLGAYTILAPNIVPGTTYSIGFWINPQPIGGGIEDLISRAGFNYGIRLDKTNGIIYYFNGGVLTAAVGVNPSSWHCIVITSDGTTLRMYHNNVLFASYMGVGVALEAALVGGNFFNNQLYADLDIPNVWDRALSADEVSMFWNAGAGIQYPF